MWAVDFVQTKDGQFADYLRYVDANWRKAREEMKRDGAVVSFAVLTEPNGEDWDVMLLTEYADLAQFDAREQSYQQAIARLRPNGGGPTLIDGKGARDLADIKSSRVLQPWRGERKWLRFARFYSTTEHQLALRPLIPLACACRKLFRFDEVSQTI